jgi:uncharacterized protein GlcG (DUF336 family)
MESLGERKMGKKDEISELNLELAKKGLLAARRYAKVATGWPCSIAVLGKAGGVIAVHRMDGAGPATLDIAIEKAWTGVVFMAPTLLLGRMTDPRTAMMPLEQLPLGHHGMGLAHKMKGKLTTIMGGIPIRDKDLGVIGGIGTSGTPSANDDNRVSQAGWSAMYDQEDVDYSDDVSYPRLAWALKVMALAEKKAKQEKAKASIAITDESGFLIALHRLDGAPFPTADIARDKAWTAAAFEMQSEQVHAYGDKNLPGFGINITNYNERTSPIPGGVPIKNKNQVIGAIGISSAHPLKDRQIALAVAKSGLKVS